MTGEISMHRGWCPTARRPTMAKDGLLVRLKISCGTLSAKTLHGIAQIGRGYGNGRFDLTTRANLQIRGVREDQMPRLTAALEDLALLDGNAAAEAVRNVLVSPLAGLNGCGEALAAARTLEELLAASMDLYDLPAKFAFLIDDGSLLSLNAISADVSFRWAGGGEPFLISIGGSFRDAVTLGHCAAKDIPQIATRLAQTFLRLASQLPEPPRCMRELIDCCGAQEIAAASGLSLHKEQRQAAPESPSPIGLLCHQGTYSFGAGALFGCFDADMLDHAARGAETCGTGEIRLTPWRALIFPLMRQEQAQTLRDYFATHGFITDCADARLSVEACGGSTNCARATTDARFDALALMFSAREFRKTGVTLQIFGCSKGCGRSGDAPVILTAHAGLYDLAANKAYFNQELVSAAGLTLAQAGAKLKALMRDETQQRSLHCR
jgi:precorrin-3B synthase